MSATDGPLDLWTAVFKLTVLAYCEGIPVQSNTARYYAAELAVAAQRGYITTLVGGSYGRVWKVTRAGMRFIQEK